jgi:hypothetical protein
VYRSRTVLVTNGLTWEFDGRTWFPMMSSGPSARAGTAIAYDIARQRTVLFGGYSLLGGSTTPPYGDTWQWGGGPLGATSAYGSGCGTPPVTLTARAGSRPVIGTAQVCDIDNAYLGVALVAWGHSNQSWQGVGLPLPLDAAGINGCVLLQSAEELASSCAPTTWSTAEHVLPIPFDPQLVGLHIYLQAWTFAPGYNPLGLATSNGIELVIGDA